MKCSGKTDQAEGGLMKIAAVVDKGRVDKGILCRAALFGRNHDRSHLDRGKGH
jgi:hypothetical protein